MGSVYEVTHLQTERRRALKVMLPSLVTSDALRGRFEREAKIGGLVQSEHIAEVIDAGVDAATRAPFFVMELLSGRELGELIEAEGPLDPEEAVRVLGQAATALDKAHAKGIVHRDLKPENLFITRDEAGESRLKILDFGIAKFMGDAAMGGATQGILGTPRFMAPEQVRAASEVTSLADLYALAHVAYATLVGEAYFTAETETADNLVQFVAAVAIGPAADPVARAKSRCGVELPLEFGDWFARASNREPEMRFQTARELVEALADCLRVPRPFKAAVSKPRGSQPKSAPRSNEDARETVFARAAYPSPASASQVGERTLVASSSSLIDGPVVPSAPYAARTTQSSMLRWVWLPAGIVAAGVLAIVVWRSGPASPTAEPTRRLASSADVQSSMPTSTAAATQAQSVQPLTAVVQSSAMPSDRAITASTASAYPSVSRGVPRVVSSAGRRPNAVLTTPTGYVPPIEER